MRKLSELYEFILGLIKSGEEIFICCAIMELDFRKIISHDEYGYLIEDFKSKRNIAVREFYANNYSLGWWGRGDSESRIAFLKHLIKLCKEQDI